MSTRGFSSAAGAVACVAAGDALGLGVGSGTAGSVSDSARAKGATATRSDAASSPAWHPLRRRLWFVVITASSFCRSSACICLLPGPDLAACLVEQTLVVALPHLLARLRRELREERRVHVVDLQVPRLLGGSDLVGPE